MVEFIQVFRALVLLWVLVTPILGNAWGANGHRMLSTVGVEGLPDEVPSFLKTPQSLWSLGELGREPDRSKGAGESHDHDLDPGHYINLGDAGLVMDLVNISPLPADRRTYGDLLHAGGLSEYQTGYLPYSILDGWQQIRKDFAYWRADAAGIRISHSSEEQAWYRRDIKLREMLILRDIGYWSHFVADASQPMHVSVHYNGWGGFPNPEGFTTEQTLHAHFEGKFVMTNINPADIKGQMPPIRNLGCDIASRTVAYLGETLRQVTPLYRLEKTGGFSAGSETGRIFVLSRLTAGAAETRDMVLAAWRCSEATEVGYPPIKINDIEAETINPISALRGTD